MQQIWEMSSVHLSWTCLKVVADSLKKHFPNIPGMITFIAVLHFFSRSSSFPLISPKKYSLNSFNIPNNLPNFQFFPQLGTTNRSLSTCFPWNRCLVRISSFHLYSQIFLYFCLVSILTLSLPFINNSEPWDILVVLI